MSKAKPFNISKAVVWDAFQAVKANKGSAGVDGLKHQYLNCPDTEIQKK